MVYNNDAVITGVSEAGRAIYVPGIFSYECSAGNPHPSSFGDIQSEDHFAAFDAKQFTESQNREPNALPASRNADFCTANVTLATLFAGQNGFDQGQQPPVVPDTTHYVTPPAFDYPSSYPPVPDTNNYGIPALVPAIEVAYPVTEAGPGSNNLQQNDVRTYVLRIAVKLGSQPSVISSQIQETSHTAGHLSEVGPTPQAKAQVAKGPRQRRGRQVGAARVHSPRRKPYDKRATACSYCRDHKVHCLRDSSEICQQCRVKSIPCERRH